MENSLYPGDQGGRARDGRAVAVPYGLLYDLTIAVIAAAWMFRAGREFGFLPLEKQALALVYVLPLFALQAGMAFRFPFAPLVGAILFLLCGLRAWHEYETRQVASSAVMTAVSCCHDAAQNRSSNFNFLLQIGTPATMGS